MDSTRDLLSQVYEDICIDDLRSAIKDMENYLALHPHQINSDRLYAIKADYQMIIDYWRKGYKDPQAPLLISKLRQRMYELYGNVAHNVWVLKWPQLSYLFSKVHLSARDWSIQFLKEQLESFVSDVAMLDLEPPHTAKERRKQLYQEHEALISDIFAYILTTNIWTAGQGEAMEELLLSPTVDSIDQQVIVSAIMLATMSCFDMAKYRTLVNVYLKSNDEFVRQRALVGWVFSVNERLLPGLYPEMKELVTKVLQEPAHVKEFVELQKQIFYCMSAERDRDMIQHEIMPDLIKNQYNISRKGLVEQDEESMLNDILHPGEEEAKLERMEAGFRKMVDMQREGSDIYFGGFSQMKRFLFFDEIANWFTPYYKDHPGIAAIQEKFGDIKFLQGMMENGPFCNSDKYSFALAFETVLNQIPKNMFDMLNRGEAAMVQNPDSADIKKPFYIRRIYLQDLYRFFRLHPMRGGFRNIFDVENTFFGRHLFICKKIFRVSDVEAFIIDVASFLIKHNWKDDAKTVLDLNIDEKYRVVDYYLLKAYLGISPYDNYMNALELDPDNERALRGIAKVNFNACLYKEALEVYERLLEKKPDNKSFLLNKAVCLTNMFQYDEAEQILFRLNYENPDDLNVVRSLAWALTGNGKYEQAGRLYDQLMATGNPTASDTTNYAFFLWFSGRIDEAANAFRSYLKDYNHDDSDDADDRTLINNVFCGEEKLIKAKGISDEEATMMCDWILD